MDIFDTKVKPKTAWDKFNEERGLIKQRRVEIRARVNELEGLTQNRKKLTDPDNHKAMFDEMLKKAKEEYRLTPLPKLPTKKQKAEMRKTIIEVCND